MCVVTAMQFVPLIFESGHVFAPSRARGLDHDWWCCTRCGVIRRLDGQNKPCRGRVRVALRAPLAPSQAV